MGPAARVAYRVYRAGNFFFFLVVVVLSIANYKIIPPEGLVVSSLSIQLFFPYLETKLTNNPLMERNLRNQKAITDGLQGFF